MTDDRHDEPREPQDHECIDLALGHDMWRRLDPACPADLRRRLEAHVAYCAACRLRVAVEDRVAAGLRDGSLSVSARATGGPRLIRVTGWTGGLSLAAGLALLLLLPPRARHEDLVLRGEGVPEIARPVPGEVVLGGRPTIRWTPLAGATRYEVRVTMVGGDHIWSTATESAEVAVPGGMDLPIGERFRVSVEPVPAYLASEGALQSSFRTGGAAEWLAYRVQRGAVVGRVLGLLGFVGFAGAGLASALRKRTM